jgi:hypothetical protein
MIPPFKVLKELEHYPDILEKYLDMKRNEYGFVHYINHCSILFN